LHDDHLVLWDDELVGRATLGPSGRIFDKFISAKRRIDALLNCAQMDVDSDDSSSDGKSSRVKRLTARAAMDDLTGHFFQSPNPICSYLYSTHIR